MSMRRLMASLAITAALAVAMPGSAWAQSGNVGGTIGKKDKVVTGGDVPANRPARKARAAADTANPGGCRSIIGTWAWFNNLAVVFKSDRTAVATNGDTSTWTCNGGMYLVTWKSMGHTDRLTLSSDGRRLSGTSTLLGIAVSATRK